MQIVIDIPEEVKHKVYNYGLSLCPSDKDQLIRAIVNGTPLPKGHGRLIDESQVTGTFTWDNGFIECFAPTIIEADTESEDKE